MTNTPNESETYQTMLHQVENIVREISSPEVDLDHMVEKVERGYSLIQTMRERLDKTKIRIDELHKNYTETNTNEAPSDG